jgi:hypothetical protein
MRNEKTPPAAAGLPKVTPVNVTELEFTAPRYALEFAVFALQLTAVAWAGQMMSNASLLDTAALAFTVKALLVTWKDPKLSVIVAALAAIAALLTTHVPTTSCTSSVSPSCRMVGFVDDGSTAGVLRLFGFGAPGATLHEMVGVGACPYDKPAKAVTIVASPKSLNRKFDIASP